MDLNKSKSVLPQNSEINLDNLISEEKKLTSKVKTNDEIFAHIIKNFTEINFPKEVGVDSEKKVRKKDELVVIVDHLISKAKALNLNLGSLDEIFYVYNKSFWSQVDKAELQDFLAKIAKRSGLNKTDANYYRFKNNLVEQFESSSRLKKKAKSKTLINLSNGTLEIDSNNFRLRDYSPDDFLTYRLNFDFDQNTNAPQFQKFLDEVLPDQSLQNILSEYIGSVFIPNSELKLEKALFLYGTGANGKSVVFEVIQALFGESNLTSLSLNKLTTCPNSRLQIQNKLLNYSSEVGEVGDLDMFKKLTSREPVDVKSLFKNITHMYNYARLMFNCNDFPKRNEFTAGYFRRFLFIPFENTIPEHKQDKSLATKIIDTELSGVFNWILAGMKRLYKNGNFSYSKKSDEFSKKFRLESDSVMMFKEEYELIPSEYEVKLMELYLKYKEFCYANGFRPCARNTFATRLVAIGFEKKRKNIGNVFYLSLKN